MEPILLAIPDRIAAAPDQSAAVALRVLADSLTEVFHSNLLLLTVEDAAEPVHKARVALRRFRALITAFEPILDEDLSDALHDRARALFRLLGSVRDADVMALRFAETDRATEMAERALEQRQKARKLLKKKKAAAFRGWVLKRLSGKGWQQTGKKAKALRSALVSELAVTALNRAWALCQTNGDQLLTMTARAQHDLRKDLKMLRYLSEFFADLWPGDAQDLFLAKLRTLQDDLGEVTDSALALALGHPDPIDIRDPQARAAADWAALMALEPWWG